MDEKTAAIPSLKDFKAQQKERSAHSARTESMQTKDQMRRSDEKQKKASAKKASQSHGSKGRGERTSYVATGNHKRVSSTSKSGSRSVSQRTSGSERRTSQGTDRPANSENKRHVAQAPHTYARERNADTEHKTHRDTSDRVGRKSAQDSRQRRSHSAENTEQNSGVKQSTGTKPVPAKSRKNSKMGNKPISPAMRKIRNFFVYLSIILVVLIVGVVLSLTVLFKTNNVNVNGLNGVYTEQDIVSASGLTLGVNIFTAPKGRAEDRIEKKFPYIEEAEVYSSFPDTINIDITIATPACVVEGLGGYYIVSDKGKVLEVSATDDEAGIPIIEGISAEATAVGEYINFGSDVIKQTMQEIFAAFKEYDCQKITAINIKAEEESFAIKYVYDNRIVVFLGLPEHINYKIQTADKIIKDKLDVGGAMVAGDLDVSMSHDTMKSYFNQYTLLAPQSAPAEGSTEKPTETTQPTESYEYSEDEYYDDSDEYYDDSENYYDDSQEDPWYSDEDYYDYPEDEQSEDY